MHIDMNPIYKNIMLKYIGLIYYYINTLMLKIIQLLSIQIKNNQKDTKLLYKQNYMLINKNQNNILNDAYSDDILRQRYTRFKDNYIYTNDLITTYGLHIRHQNPPEDITENIAKFAIRNYDNDSTCVWAKSVNKKGDLYSEKYPNYSQPEIKAFTSDGPSSFGPQKKFGIIYFLDMRQWLSDKFILWKVNVSDESSEWKQIKMNKTQTYEDQCNEGRRPHISWDNIYSQIPNKCIKVYEGSFEGIFLCKQ